MPPNFLEDTYRISGVIEIMSVRPVLSQSTDMTTKIMNIRKMLFCTSLLLLLSEMKGKIDISNPTELTSSPTGDAG